MPSVRGAAVSSSEEVGVTVCVVAVGMPLAMQHRSTRALRT